VTTYGWDSSHYDTPPDGKRVVAEGFSFVTHKAGGDANDAELAAYWRGVKDIPDPDLLKGAYWVLYPGNPIGRADDFLARLDSQCPGWRNHPFILQADCEEWNGDPKTKPGLSDIKAFCNRLKSKMPKLEPVVYASAGQYGSSLTGLGYPLWNARYVLSNQTGTASGLYARCGGDSGKGWGRYSGQIPAIWQFTASATITGQTTCDANAYRGTLQQLTALVAPGWEDDVALTDADKSWFTGQLATVTAADKPQTDGTPTSKIGRLAFNQGIPNGTKVPAADGSHPRDYAWQVISDLGAELVALRQDVGDLKDAVVAIPQAQLDLAVLNALKTLAGGQA
jgi:GH25 family lysozyme M1 (1,4-beta-N-acetylmuramidase)